MIYIHIYTLSAVIEGSDPISLFLNGINCEGSILTGKHNSAQKVTLKKKVKMAHEELSRLFKKKKKAIKS